MHRDLVVAGDMQEPALHMWEVGIAVVMRCDPNGHGAGEPVPREGRSLAVGEQTDHLFPI